MSLCTLKLRLHSGQLFCILRHIPVSYTHLEYASYIKDSMVAELTDLYRNLMMSIDVVPVPTDEAVP